MNYIHVLPLLDTELGLGWHKDTVYHSALIRSIIQFGYPSIAQHDVLLTPYHVLSHYVDALITTATQIDVYDSYGLLFQFKIWMILSAITVFVAKVSELLPTRIFMLALFLLMPMILGSWHIIGSHGLWFTSVILIFGSIKYFDILVKKGNLSLGDYVMLFLIAILVSLGKVSSGFALTCFLGFFLVLRDPVDKRIYIFGLIMLAFFFLYQNFLRSGSAGGPVTSGLTIPDLQSIYQLYFDADPARLLFIWSNCLSLIVLAVLYFFDRRVENIRALIAATASFSGLILLLASSPYLQPSDVSYFFYGISSVLILITFQFVARSIGQMSADNANISMGNYSVGGVLYSLLVLYMIASNYYYLQSTDWLFAKQRFSIAQLEFDYKRPIVFDEVERPLLRFREHIDLFLNEHKLTRKNSVLFVSKEIFENEVSSLGGHSWARGMLLYATSGVPLVYGAEGGVKGYGFSRFSPREYRLEESPFGMDKVCSAAPDKTPFRAVHFTPPIFETIKCSGSHPKKI